MNKEEKNTNTPDNRKITLLIVFTAIGSDPQEKRIWGVLVLVFSIIGFTGMGFSILDAILGIIGGIIALSERGQIIPADRSF